MFGVFVALFLTKHVVHEFYSTCYCRKDNLFVNQCYDGLPRHLETEFIGIKTKIPG